MEQEYLIDTNTVIDYLGNKLPQEGMGFMHEIINRMPSISVITKIEVLRFEAPEVAYRVLTDFIGDCVVWDINEPVVEHTIALCKGSRIKLPDAIIAATALVHGYGLITRNTSDFKGVAGLTVVNPWEI